MSSDGGTLVKFAIIWVFAGAIVALGLRDLYQMHGGGKSVSRIEVENLVKNLHGNVDVKKASMNPGEVQAIQDSGEEDSPSQVPKSLSDVAQRLFPDAKK